MKPDQRSKKRLQPWIQAAVHFSLCFAVGALAALAPPAAAGRHRRPVGRLYPRLVQQCSASGCGSAGSTACPGPRPLLVVMATRPDGGMAQDASLARLAHTLRHVAPPLLWIVVGAENRTATARAVRVLRGTGVMFRHLTYNARNFTGADADAGDEEDNQRNVALGRIERHRLNGVVHFASASSINNLRFFQELRQTRPTQGIQALMKPKEPPPIWVRQIPAEAAGTQSSEPLKINISGIGFRSSMLWNSERSFTMRNSSAGATQDFIQIVHQMAIEGENKLKGITSECSQSRIMLWHLDMQRFTLIIPEGQETQVTQQQQSLVVRDEDKPTTRDC